MTADDLHGLSPDQAMDLLRELLRAEADAVGVGIRLIHQLTARTAVERGIDVDIKTREISGGLGILSTGLTRYQVIAGSVMPTSKRDFENIFLVKDRNELKSGTQECLSAGGRYVMVLFGGVQSPIISSRLTSIVQEIMEENGLSFRKGTITVWRQSQLLEYVHAYPMVWSKVDGSPSVKRTTDRLLFNRRAIRGSRRPPSVWVSRRAGSESGVRPGPAN